MNEIRGSKLLLGVSYELHAGSRKKGKKVGHPFPFLSRRILQKKKSRNNLQIMHLIWSKSLSENIFFNEIEQVLDYMDDLF